MIVKFIYPAYDAEPLIIYQNDDSYVSNREYYNLNEFDLRIMKEYLVHGIMYTNNQVYYLITCESNFCPKWFHSDIFEIVESKLPIAWNINEYYDHNHTKYIVMSYFELANNYEYFIALINEDFKALEIFKNNYDIAKETI